MSDHLQCNDQRYLKNLLKSLEYAKEHQDINRICEIAGEVTRYKVLCGFSQPIAEFEASLKRFSQEMGLEDAFTNTIEAPLEMKLTHKRNVDIKRSFDFNSFTPPDRCEPESCPNIHCEVRKAAHAGQPCIYAKPITNQELKNREH